MLRRNEVVVKINCVADKIIILLCIVPFRHDLAVYFPPCTSYDDSTPKKVVPAWRKTKKKIGTRYPRKTFSRDSGAEREEGKWKRKKWQRSLACAEPEAGNGRNEVNARSVTECKYSV